MFDLLGVVAIAPVVFPVLVVTSLALFYSGHGIIFRQIRVGKEGRHFNIYKFKTMYEKVSAAIVDQLEHAKSQGRLFKTDRDPRITPLGRVLRRFSIDELPQLINVIKGDMSLVGPRPLVPHMIDLGNEIHRQRLQVRPGITGLWQVRNRKNNVSIEQMLVDDLEYISSWYCVSGDVFILMKTLPAIISGKGAI